MPYSTHDWRTAITSGFTSRPITEARSFSASRERPLEERLLDRRGREIPTRSFPTGCSIPPPPSSLCTTTRGCAAALAVSRRCALSIEDVRHNTVAAAFEDSRFPPVGPEELAGLTLEVTLLSARELLHCRSECDALDQMRPGVDGLVLTYGSRRATFLPQVWDSIPQASAFLEALKEKAGLEHDFWHRSIVIERYTALSWNELSSARSRALE